MTIEDAAGDFQRSTRMPLDAVVRLHFEGTVAFQNGFAANVSASGMFVKHPDPPPVGTRLVFEFGIGSQRRPVQGGGVVVWSREKYEGPGRPAGAGIRFVDLDELSRQHLAEALFEFLEASLGDRVGEHPEVAGLVSSVPTHAPADFEIPEPSAEPEADEAASNELLADISDAAPDPPSGDFTPFRIFDEEPAPLSPADLGTLRVEIPSASRAIPPASPLVPPPPRDPAVLEPYSPVEPIAGVAIAQDARSSRSPLLVGLLVVLLGAAGAAGWWFFLRQSPGLAATASDPSGAAAPAEATPAPEPEAPPPLDPTPGPDTTLAESVGATRPAPKTAVPAARPSGAPGSTVTPKAAPEASSAAEAPVAPGSGRLTVVREITATSIGGGTTVVLAGDGGFHEGSFTWSEIGGDKPRVLIKLKQIEQPFRGSVRSVPTAEVANVRTGYHQNPGGNELHVVLDLAPSVPVTVETVEPSGDSLVVRLVRR